MMLISSCDTIYGFDYAFCEGLWFQLGAKLTAVRYDISKMS